MGARADDLSATTAPTTIEVSQGEALPPGDTGTTGTGGGGGSKKLCGVCVLPPSAAPSGARDSSGTAGTGVGQLLTDPTDLPGLACAIEAAGVVGLDIETAGQDTLDPRRSRPRLLQLALPDGSVRVVDLFATGGPGPLVEALSKIEVVGHNLGFDLGFLRHHFGITPRACWDSMLASQLVSGVEQPNGQRHPKGYHSLEAVLERALGVKLDKTMQKSDWSGLLTSEQIAYAADDVAHLFPLREALERGLEVRSLGAVMRIECDLLPAIVGMELAGVPVDLAALDALAVERGRLSVEARERVRVALGIDNPNSHPQLLRALRAMGLDVASTGAETLAPYQDRPVVRDLQTMRTEKKTADDARSLAEVARSQVDGDERPEHARPAEESRNARVHRGADRPGVHRTGLRGDRASRPRAGHG